ncbi:MAG: AEX-3 domain-containing protein [Monoraphidium minutum]|nr:MAG: AEX-3 domain-containing protein [Monoraphidium minutum]
MPPEAVAASVVAAVAAAAAACEDGGEGAGAADGGAARQRQQNGGGGGGAGAGGGAQHQAGLPSVLARWLPRIEANPIALAEAECAEQLQIWAVAALCRSLSLDNVLALVNAALLEKQIAVFCPHIGTLCACVLSLVPLLRPFVWQSLLLPVTPASMRGFLEAPVPFVLGLQYKTPEVSVRCASLVRVNVYKDKVKHRGAIPQMPSARRLATELAPHHAALRGAAGLAADRPVHLVSAEEAAAARRFLHVMLEHLVSLTGDLRLHTIVNVGMSKRTGLLLKDAMVESFPPRDRPFMRAFAETQMFAVYSDAVIREYCDEV